MSTVIITGSRNWPDAKILYTSLDIEHGKSPITTLVEGGANGADTLAALWAKQKSLMGPWIEIVTIPADWSLHGRSAGPKRNIEMLTRYPDARVIAFPMSDSKGTLHCMQQALKRGMKVTNYGCRVFIDGKEV